MAAEPGFHPHLPGAKYTFLSKAIGATMWFFIFYRFRCVLLGLPAGCLAEITTVKTAGSFWASIPGKVMVMDMDTKSIIDPL
ncbi:hypothetical protein EYR38_006559 [Pleurotus pulmonarius]|nr:hypothetical protein EYR38_006559 [Pleurotus pulmonarius]